MSDHYCCSVCHLRYDDCICPKVVHPAFAGLGPRPETRPLEVKRGGRPPKPSTSQQKESREDRLPARPNKWGLTRTQAHIVALRVEGLEVNEIAKDMCISIKTVNTHVFRSCEKMGVKTMSRAMLLWDREFYRRPEPLSYNEIMRINLGREPTEAEVFMNLHIWEKQPEVYEYALELARRKLPEMPGLALELAAKRLSEIGA